jgi:hypothetical protein
VVLPLLEYGLHDPRPPVRRRAAALLGRLGPQAAPIRAELARRAAEDPDPFVRQAALDAALELSLRPSEAIALLADRLTDPAVALRLGAIAHLARRSSDPAARAALRRAAADPDPDVRRAALEALEPPPEQR